MKLRKIPTSMTIKVLMTAQPAIRVGLIAVDAHSAGSPKITHQVLENLIRHGQAKPAPANGRNAVFLTETGFLWFNRHRQEVEQGIRKKAQVAKRAEAAADLVEAYGSEWAVNLLAKIFANKPVVISKTGLMPRISNTHVRSLLKRSFRTPGSMLAVASAWVGAGLVRNPDGFNAPLRPDMDFFLTKLGQRTVDSYAQARALTKKPFSEAGSVS